MSDKPKTYEIKVRFSGYGYIEVEAQSEVEAIQIAGDNFGSDHFHEWNNDHCSVESVSGDEDEKPEAN